MSETQKGAQNAPYPKPATAWYMVSLLTIAYILSYADRNILSLLVEPIKADLQLSDTEIGLLMGPAFAILYATMGLPLGWLADKKRRTWIVAAGVFVWSAATALSGLARSFWQLFAARMTVGIGEATLSPCAMSMISDSFPKEKRGRPIAVYSAAISVGAGVSSLVGAGVLAWANASPELVFPVVGALKPWQLVFFIVGAPGLFLGFLFLILREPARRIEASAEELAKGTSLLDMLSHVGARWGTYGLFISVFAFMTITAYSQGFLPAMFIRTYGWTAEQYAVINGTAILLIAPLTVNIAGWMSDRLFSKGMKDAPLRIALFGVFIIAPTGLLAPLMPNGVLAYAVFCLNTAGIATTTSTGVTALLNIAPSRIKAQVIAFYYMCISMLGLFIGPPLVGWLTDNIFGYDNLNYSMALLPLVFGGPVMLLAPLILKKYMAEFKVREALEAEGVKTETQGGDG